MKSIITDFKLRLHVEENSHNYSHILIKKSGKIKLQHFMKGLCPPYKTDRIKNKMAEYPQNVIMPTWRHVIMITWRYLFRFPSPVPIQKSRHSREARCD